MAERDEKTVLIRLSGSRRKPEERRVPVAEAARLFVEGKAEPVLDVRDEPPPLLAGLGIAAALQFMREEPAPWAAPFVMVMPRSEIIADREPRSLRVREGCAPASWFEVVHGSGLPDCVAAMDAPDAPESVPVDEANPRSLTASHKQVVCILVEVSLREFRKRERTRAFLEWLALGTLRARGVWEDDLANFKERDIPAGWWTMDVMIDLEDGSLWEHTPRTGMKFTRRFSQVTVFPEKVAAAEQESVTRTGAPGRPSAMHLVEAEFVRRAEEGAIEESLAQQAKALAAWFEAAHPQLPCPTPKTIENRLRDAYRKAKSTPKSS